MPDVDPAQAPAAAPRLAELGRAIARNVRAIAPTDARPSFAVSLAEATRAAAQPAGADVVGTGPNRLSGDAPHSPASGNAPHSPVSGNAPHPPTPSPARGRGGVPTDVDGGPAGAVAGGEVPSAASGVYPSLNRSAPPIQASAAARAGIGRVAAETSASQAAQGAPSSPSAQLSAGQSATAPASAPVAQSAQPASTPVVQAAPTSAAVEVRHTAQVISTVQPAPATQVGQPSAVTPTAVLVSGQPTAVPASGQAPSPQASAATPSVEASAVSVGQPGQASGAPLAGVPMLAADGRVVYVVGPAPGGYYGVSFSGAGGTPTMGIYPTSALRTIAGAYPHGMQRPAPDLTYQPMAGTSPAAAQQPAPGVQPGSSSPVAITGTPAPATGLPLARAREMLSATRGSGEAEGARASWTPIVAPRSGAGGEGIAPAAGAGPITRSLDAYPRPARGDRSGILNWDSDVPPSRADADRLIAEAKRRRAGWVTFVASTDDPEAYNDAAKRIAAAGLQPVARIQDPEGDLPVAEIRALVKELRAHGVRYVQLFDGANLAAQSPDDRVDVKEYAGRWLAAARAVVAEGALPGVGALDPNGDYDDLGYVRQLLGTVKAAGGADALGQAWVAMRGETPGATAGPSDLDGLAQRAEWYDRLSRHALGRSLPILATGDPAGRVERLPAEPIQADPTAAVDRAERALRDRRKALPALFAASRGTLVAARV